MVPTSQVLPPSAGGFSGKLRAIFTSLRSFNAVAEGALWNTRLLAEIAEGNTLCYSFLQGVFDIPISPSPRNSLRVADSSISQSAAGPLNARLPCTDSTEAATFLLETRREVSSTGASSFSAVWLSILASVTA